MDLMVTTFVTMDGVMQPMSCSGLRAPWMTETFSDYVGEAA
jgi:hypothetical protein